MPGILSPFRFHSFQFNSFVISPLLFSLSWVWLMQITLWAVSQMSHHHCYYSYILTGSWITIHLPIASGLSFTLHIWKGVPQRVAVDVWCQPSVWNLRAVIWFPIPVSCLIFFFKPSPLALFFFFFFGHVLFQFLCNLQQYCDSAYNKLNSLQQKEFIDITKMNYIWRKKRRERRRQTHMHSRTHACMRARTHARARAHPPTHPHTHTHTHTQFQTKIQAIKRPNKQIKDDPNKIVLT